MMNNNNTSNFNNNPSDPSKTYVYCYMGLASGFLLLMLSITLFSHYCCSTRNPENRRQSRGRHGGGGNNNSNRTVILVERDNSVVTIDVCEEQREAILNGFPVLLYSQVKPNDHKADDSTSLICSICLADYKESEWLRLVPDCGHYFHKECVDAWFRLNLSCPMCRNSPLTTPLAQVTPLAITRHDDSVAETAVQSVTIRIQ